MNKTVVMTMLSFKHLVRKAQSWPATSVRLPIRLSIRLRVWTTLPLCNPHYFTQPYSYSMQTFAEPWTRIFSSLVRRRHFSLSRTIEILYIYISIYIFIYIFGTTIIHYFTSCGTSNISIHTIFWFCVGQWFLFPPNSITLIENISTLSCIWIMLYNVCT